MYRINPQSDQLMINFPATKIFSIRMVCFMSSVSFAIEVSVSAQSSTRINLTCRRHVHDERTCQSKVDIPPSSTHTYTWPLGPLSEPVKCLLRLLCDHINHPSPTNWHAIGGALLSLSFSFALSAQCPIGATTPPALSWPNIDRLLEDKRERESDIP